MKITQLTTIPEGDNTKACIVALGEDGRAFARTLYDNHAPWIELPALPDSPQV